MSRLRSELVTILHPQDIGRVCMSEGLISPPDFTDITTARDATKASVNDMLLDMLQGTGTAGYVVFKKILSRWKSPHRYANLLSKIEDVETEVRQLEKSVKKVRNKRNIYGTVPVSALKIKQTFLARCMATKPKVLLWVMM